MLGVFLILTPDLVMGLIGIEGDQGVWLRAVGAPVLVLGVFYLGAVRNNSQWLFSYSVLGRMLAALALAYLAIVDGPWQLWLFAGVDAFGATWTYLALRPPKPKPEPVVDPTPEQLG